MSSGPVRMAERRRWTGLVLVVLLALTSATVTPMIASAAASMTLDQFQAAYLGKALDVDSAPAGDIYQCVDVFKEYDRKVLGGDGPRTGGNGYAYNYWTVFTPNLASRYTKVAADQPARRGDVAVWGSGLPGSGGAGHIAIVLTDEGSRLQVLQQNWASTKHVTINSNGKAHLLGYLRPLNLPGGVVGEGSFIRATDNGEVYRIAGGAPLYVSSWTPFGGSQPLTDQTRAQINALPQYPRDGTFVSGASTGKVYRFAGGSPHYVSTWASFGGPQNVTVVDDFTLDRPDLGSPLNHVRRYPAEGSFVSNTADGRVYRIAGGAPLYVSSWQNIGGAQPVTSLDPWDFVHYANMRPVPADRYLRGLPSQRIFRVQSGRPLYVQSWDAHGGPQPFLDVDDWAIDRCDHLECSPLGNLDRVVGGPRSVSVSGWAFDPNVLGSATGIRIAVGGPLGSGKEAVFDRSTDVTRSDVATSYPGVHPRAGFEITVSSAVHGRVPVHIYALNAAGTPGATVKLGEGTVTVGQFTDVPLTHPFYQGIAWAAERGITSGYPDQSFRPAAPINRDALAAMLFRNANPGATKPTCAAAPFPDVPMDHPFCGEITWMKSAGVTRGNANGTYGAGESVSRQAVAAFLARAWGPAPLQACAAAPFTDVPVSHPFCAEIGWLKAAGVTLGNADGSFSPGDPISRQAFVTYLFRHSA